MDYNPSVSTINSKSIKDTNSDNIAGAIRSAQGVYMQESSGRRGEPSLSIRGFSGTQIGLYLDGIPMMSIYDRQTDFGQYVTQGIESIQVSKGFTSPIYGINIMGGAVNMVSMRPEKELEISFRQRLLFGRHSSPDEVRQGFGIGSNVGKFYFQADISHTNRSQYPFSSDFKPTPIQTTYDAVNSYYNNKTAKLKAGIMPNENHEYSLNFIYQRGEKGGLIEDGTSGNAPYWGWPHYDKKTLYLLGNSYFTPDLSLNTRLYYDNFYNQTKMYGCYNKATGVLSTSMTKPGFCVAGGSVYDDDTYGGILALNYDIFEQTNLKIGINVKYDTHLEIKNDGTTEADLREIVSSEFIQLAQGVANFRFIIAGTYDRISTVKEQNSKNNKAADMGKGNFSLQGAVYYDFAQGNTVHINVGKKQNLPTLKQRYSEIFGQSIMNPDLEIESAINYEVGYDLAYKSTNLSVAVFYNDMKNMFVQKTLTGAEATCDNPNKGECKKNVNVDSGYTYGGEVGVEQDFFADDMLILGANYSFIQKYAKGDALTDYAGANGKKIIDYPNHIANAKIIIKPIPSLEFIGLGRFESGRYYPDSNGGYDKSANYFTLDLSANYELGKGLSVNAGVLNLTDRDNWTTSYQARFGTFSTYHYAGRQWFAGFEYKY